MCLYFSYHTYYGERSQVHLDDLSIKLDLKKTEAQELSLVRTSLEKKVAMLRPASLSKDMLDEQARFMLGFSSSDDILIIGN
ncbi:MAG: FtsB family cell division protein [Alphaproteobacteria bacterium]